MIGITATLKKDMHLINNYKETASNTLNKHDFLKLIYNSRKTFSSDNRSVFLVNFCLCVTFFIGVRLSQVF